MEEIVEGPIRVVFRIIRWLLIEALCEFVFFHMGRLFLLTITFTRYPNKSQCDQHEGRISFVGFVVTVALVVFISIGLNDNPV